MCNNTRALKWGVLAFDYLFWGGANCLGLPRLGWGELVVHPRGTAEIRTPDHLRSDRGCDRWTIFRALLEWAEYLCNNMTLSEWGVMPFGYLIWSGSICADC